MGKIRFFCALIIATMLCSGYAYAAEDYGVKAGNSEISAMLQGQTTKPNGGDSMSVTTLMGSYGYFWSDNIQIGAGLIMMSAKSGDTEASTTILTPNVKYHFHIDDPKYVPYVGLSLLTGGIKAAGSTMTLSGYEAQGGVDCFIGPNVAVAFELATGSMTISASGGGSYGATSTTYRIPLKVFF